MSVQALNDLYIELNRLVIAGSNLAKDDYRIKKLIPIFNKSGETAPVFNKVSSLCDRLTASEEHNRSEALLELVNLVIAMLKTVSKTGLTGELTPINSLLGIGSTNLSYRKLKPIMEALNEAGQGRLSVLQEALREGCFTDLRLIHPLVKALSDSNASVSEFAASRLKDFGPLVIPVVKGQIDLNNYKLTSKIIFLVSSIARNNESEWYKTFLCDTSHDEVLIAALDALKYSEEHLDLVIEYTTHKKKAVRETAYTTLGHYQDIEATNTFYKAFDKKDRDILKEGLRHHDANDLIQYIISQVKETLEALKVSMHFIEAKTQNKTLPYSDKQVGLIYDGLNILSTKRNTELIDLYYHLSEDISVLTCLEAPKSSIYKTIAESLADHLLAFKSNETLTLLKNLDDYFIKHAFVASTVLDEPKAVYQTFSKILKNGHKDKKATGIVDLFYFLANGIQSPEHQLLLETLQETYHRLDPRFLDHFIDLDSNQVVLLLLHGDSKKIGDYLMNKARTLLSNKRLPWEPIKALQTIHYKHTHKFILEIVEMILKMNHKYITIDLDVLSNLPSDSSKKLEELGRTYSNQELIDTANELRNGKK